MIVTTCALRSSASELTCSREHDQAKDDQDRFTAESVCSRVPADLAEFFSGSSTRLQGSILLKRCFRSVYGLGWDRGADPGYDVAFHLIPVLK